MTHLTEIALVLFWLGYVGLHGWLLRAPNPEAAGLRTPFDPLQGETSCTTPATR